MYTQQPNYNLCKHTYAVWNFRQQKAMSKIGIENNPLYSKLSKTYGRTFCYNSLAFY